MKLKFILCWSLLLNFIIIQAQQMQKVVASFGAGSLGSIEIYTEEFVFFLTENGSISGFTTNNFNGSFDYHDNEHFEKEKYGKLKNCGDTKIEYWLTFNVNDARYGKVKSIGKVTIDYWDNHNYEKEKFGRVKNIGTIPVDYWDRDGFDTARYGKIKNIGNIFVDYWENEPLNKAKYGKIKSFGPVKFDYWDNYYSDKEKFGKLKSVTGNSDKIQVKFNHLLFYQTSNYQPY